MALSRTAPTTAATRPHTPAEDSSGKSERPWTRYTTRTSSAHSRSSRSRLVILESHGQPGAEFSISIRQYTHVLGFSSSAWARIDDGNTFPAVGPPRRPRLNRRTQITCVFCGKDAYGRLDPGSACLHTLNRLMQGAPEICIQPEVCSYLSKHLPRWLIWGHFVLAPGIP